MTGDDAKRRWPRLCADVKCGWYAPDGWDGPISKLCDLLERMPGIVCIQTKEKFAELRFYVSVYPDPSSVVDVSLAMRLIQACEAACDKLCQDCGKPGRLYPGTWLRTSCEACQAAWASKKSGVK